VKAADNIRFHFKDFRRLYEGHPNREAHGATGLQNVEPEDPLFELDWEEHEWYCYAMRNGEAVVQRNAFAHIWMNVDEIEGQDMSNDDWLDSTISGVQASIVRCASTIGHEFAHAMVLLTLGGDVPEPRFNGESLSDDKETSYSWENFVFGGSLQLTEGQAVYHLFAKFQQRLEFQSGRRRFSRAGRARRRSSSANTIPLR
jgi:hypothetical protein